MEPYYFDPEMFFEQLEGPLGNFLALFLGIFGSIMLLAVVVGIVFWCLEAAGLYKIARRRGIYNAWLAWIPVGRLWVIGCISDQYKYLKDGNKQNRRSLLLWLELSKHILTVLYYVGVAVMALNPDLSGAIVMAGLWSFAEIAVAAISITQAVFVYIAYYNLFKSCDPDNATVYLVLGILFSICMPIFVFASRKKDKGMPPVQPQAEPAYAPAEPEALAPAETEEAPEAPQTPEEPPVSEDTEEAE